jgi:hypothetical protein
MDQAVGLKDILQSSLPGPVARKLPSPQLLAAWCQAAGEILAERARPVCLTEQGVLLVSVSGSAWRQEIVLAAPALLTRLTEQGFSLKAIKVVAARTPPQPTVSQPLPELSDAEEAQIQAQMAQVSDEKLRQALARVMRAQLRARKASGI